jgi:hypothetical protein
VPSSSSGGVQFVTVELFQYQSQPRPLSPHAGYVFSSKTMDQLHFNLMQVTMALESLGSIRQGEALPRLFEFHADLLSHKPREF